MPPDVHSHTISMSPPGRPSPPSDPHPLRPLHPLHPPTPQGHEFSDDRLEARTLPHSGDYHFRAAPGSEVHMNDPAAIAALQAAATGNDSAAYRKFSALNTRWVGGGGWGGGGGWALVGPLLPLPAARLAQCMCWFHGCCARSKAAQGKPSRSIHHRVAKHYHQLKHTP